MQKLLYFANFVFNRLSSVFGLFVSAPGFSLPQFVQKGGAKSFFGIYFPLTSAAAKSTERIFSAAA